MSVHTANCAAEELEIDPRELHARLKCPPEQITAAVSKCRDAVNRAAACRVCWTQVPVSYPDANVVRLDGITVHSASLYAVLYPCRSAILMAATLGTGVDRLLMQAALRSPVQQYTLDAVASALIEAWCERAETVLCTNRPHTCRFSPGYGDLPLSLQQSLLERLDAQRKIGVCLTDACLMTPTKSVTAIIGLWENELKKE